MTPLRPEDLTPEQIHAFAAAYVVHVRESWEPAELAMADMVDALAQRDPSRARLLMDGAKVNATLAHREALQEATAMLREVVAELIYANSRDRIREAIDGRKAA